MVAPSPSMKDEPLGLRRPGIGKAHTNTHTPASGTRPRWLTILRMQRLISRTPLSRQPPDPHPTVAAPHMRASCKQEPSSSQHVPTANPCATAGASPTCSRRLLSTPSMHLHHRRPLLPEPTTERPHRPPLLSRLSTTTQHAPPPAAHSPFADRNVSHSHASLNACPSAYPGAAPAPPPHACRRSHHHATSAHAQPALLCRATTRPHHTARDPTGLRCRPRQTTTSCKISGQSGMRGCAHPWSRTRSRAGLPPSAADGRGRRWTRHWSRC